MGALEFAEPAWQCQKGIGYVDSRFLVSMGGTGGGWAEFQATREG